MSVVIVGRPLAITPCLQLEQLGIDTPLSHQLVVRAGLDHGACVQHDDPVSPSEPSRNDGRSAA